MGERRGELGMGDSDEEKGEDGITYTHFIHTLPTPTHTPTHSPPTHSPPPHTHTPHTHPLTDYSGQRLCSSILETCFSHEHEGSSTIVECASIGSGHTATLLHWEEGWPELRELAEVRSVGSR